MHGTHDPRCWSWWASCVLRWAPAAGQHQTQSTTRQFQTRLMRSGHARDRRSRCWWEWRTLLLGGTKMGQCSMPLLTWQLQNCVKCGAAGVGASGTDVHRSWRRAAGLPDQFSFALRHQRLHDRSSNCHWSVSGVKQWLCYARCWGVQFLLMLSFLSHSVGISGFIAGAPLSLASPISRLR